MPQYVRTELRPGAFAVVWLEREPVNLMDLTMWQQLTAALEELEADEVCASSCIEIVRGTCIVPWTAAPNRKRCESPTSPPHCTEQTLFWCLPVCMDIPSRRVESMQRGMQGKGHQDFA